MKEMEIFVYITNSGIRRRFLSLSCKYRVPIRHRIRFWRDIYNAVGFLNQVNGKGDTYRQKPFPPRNAIHKQNILSARYCG